MDPYRHHVSGFFAPGQDAERALAELVRRGLPRERLQMFDAGVSPPAAATPVRSDAALKDMLVDGAVGAAVGTGIGALAELALVAANISLFIASPLIAPLVMLGWGASLGGLVGAMRGAGSATPGAAAEATAVPAVDGKFAALVRDAISSGQVVLVAETHTQEETALAREVIEAAVGASRDAPAAGSPPAPQSEVPAALSGTEAVRID